MENILEISITISIFFNIMQFFAVMYLHYLDKQNVLYFQNEIELINIRDKVLLEELDILTELYSDTKKKINNEDLLVILKVLKGIKQPKK